MISGNLANNILLRAEQAYGDNRDMFIDYIHSLVISEDVRNHHQGICFRVNETDVNEDEGFTKPCVCGSTMHWQSHWECLTCKKGMK